jgi:chromodomain-helicase-DNA-binding protein 4
MAQDTISDSLTRPGRKKSAGSLPEFDPFGTNVHHYSHPKLMIRLKRPTSASTHSEDSEGNYRAESETSSEYDDVDAPYKLRRSGRTIPGSEKKRTLAYSPRKTRSHKLFISRDSDGEDDSEAEEVAPPIRKSTRSKAKANTSSIYEEYLNESDDDLDGYGSPKVDSGLQRKVIRGKASRPAYGNFRVVADLDFDPCSDQETAPLRAHRDTCEKCGRSPTHVLLSERLGKPKSKGRQRKDDDEDDSDDVEKISALGGWVRWYVVTLFIFNALP